jgi:exodeoxyribonuclease VII small subunit
MLEIKMKDFESNLKQLEEIVGKLESGDLTLDQSLQLFEEGVKISRCCNAMLEEAERKVEVLMKGSDGGMVATPFTVEGESPAK